MNWMIYASAAALLAAAVLALAVASGKKRKAPRLSASEQAGIRQALDICERLWPTWTQIAVWDDAARAKGTRFLQIHVYDDGGLRQELARELGMSVTPPADGERWKYDLRIRMPFRNKDAAFRELIRQARERFSLEDAIYEKDGEYMDFVALLIKAPE